MDFIWLPRSSFDVSVEEMVAEMINTSLKMDIASYLNFALNQILYLWADKYIVSDNFRKFKEMVDLSSMELPSFKETAFQSKMARMRRIGFKDGRTEGFKDGETAGFNRGKAEVQEHLVRNLLKHYDAKKVSVITGLDLDYVRKIDNGK